MENEYLCTALKETSPVIKSFWYGKFLQVLKSKGLEDSTIESSNIAVKGTDHIADAKTHLLKSQTFLSQSVNSLVTQSIPPLLPRDAPSFINADLILDWSAIEKYLSTNIISEQQIVTGKNYSDVAKQLGIVAKQVHIMVTSIDHTKVMMILSRMYHWTHKPELYNECIELILSGSSCPIDVHLSLLMCTAALERSLGDVYLHVSGARQCHRLLRDLLATRELDNVFGQIPMLCLQCLIGPPNGFNLRNILWHGFAAQGEVPKELALFLLIVAASLGNITDKYLPIPHRPFIIFPQEPIMETKFPDFSSADMESVKHLFENSFFVVPSMLSIWLKALDNYQNEKYGYFLCLILPCLENALRRVFACCNHCPQRILTAESTVLYTTFDEILCQTIQDGKELNQLQYEITTSYMEMLMDVLVHPEGPRLRDRISHGEANLDLISKTLANFVLGMCVALCGHYSILLENKCLVSEASSVITDDYVSLFHPCSMLKREMLTLFVEMRNWKDIASYHGDEEQGELVVLTECVTDYNSTVHFLLCCISEMSHSSMMDSHMCDEFNTQPLEILVELVWSKPIHTLYMCRNDLEITGILRRAVYHLTAAISQIHSTATQRYELYQLKQLRSRQRGNFDRLLSCIGVFWSCAVLVSIMICIGVNTYPTNPEISDKKIRYFKKVLQFTENFFSQTSPSRNRWEEAAVLCNALVQLCMKLQSILYSPSLHTE